MEIKIKYKGKIVTDEGIYFIKELIKNNPNDSRRALSKKLCIAWNWVQLNGALRDMYCRGFMLELHRAGYINLPPKKATPNNPLVNRRKPVKIAIERIPVKKKLTEVQPLDFKQVRGTSLEKTYNSLIAEYHYLGYSHPVGEHLKYIIYWNNKPISCIAFSSAPRHIGSRDRFIGWSKEI